MVAKISIGSSLYGALAYNGEKMNEEHGRILGANKVTIPIDGKVNIGAMAKDFMAFMPKMGKTKKPVLHISLNPHPDDWLTDQDFEILAREYLDKLGFGEQPYIIYKHEDIDRHHVHIVTVNVSEQGKRLNQDFLFRRSKKITTELEQNYNLHKVQRERVDPDAPIKKVDSAGDIKRQVANAVKLVGMRYKFQTIGEYNAILSLYNIRCEQTDGRVNGREYHGLVYFATDVNGNTIANPFKASRLGKFASRAAVEGRYERSRDKINVAPTKRKVQYAMAHATGKDDFVAKLKADNIDVLFRYTSEGRIYGVTFIDHNTATVLNGSRLGREYSANAIQAWLDNLNAPIQQTPSAQSQNTSNQGQSTSSPSQNVAPVQSNNGNDYEMPTLPGLDLFQVGPGVDPEEEAFIRAMRRRKKKRRGPKL